MPRSPPAEYSQQRAYHGMAAWKRCCSSSSSPTRQQNGDIHEPNNVGDHRSSPTAALRATNHEHIIRTPCQTSRAASLFPPPAPPPRAVLIWANTI
eukprot:COSAG01_NODE_2180_length_8215_cov_3.853006_13_plen_96_part_00